jgi:phosphoribosylglycinamide formyltransferase-1
VRAVEARVAVLASGEGTNLQALLDDPGVGPRVALVVSDRPGARALERARRAGVRAELLDPAGFPDRDAHERALLALLAGARITHVALAGYMRVLGPAVVEAYRGRMLNVHPSLLPAFPGAHAVRDALAWGVKVTGVTVHLVDEEVDHGPIVFQEAVPVLEDDDEAGLLARLHEVEHRLYPAAVRALLEGRLEVRGRRVRVLEAARG